MEMNQNQYWCRHCDYLSSFNTSAREWQNLEVGKAICKNRICKKELALKSESGDIYFLKRLLAKGGGGIVYIACKVGDLEENKNYAVKFSHDKKINSEIANLTNAKNAGARVPEFIDYSKSSDDFFYIQEYIEGNNLRTFIKSKHNGLTEGNSCFEQEEIFKYLIDLLQTITLIHNQGIIHRDIKPLNIIVQANTEKLYLVDFGSSKELMRDNITIPPPMTEGYSPPELLLLEAAEDEKERAGITNFISEEGLQKYRYTRDIYSSALTIIEMIAGADKNIKRRLPNQNDWNWLMADIKKKFRQIHTFLTEMSSFYPSDRYQTAMEALLDVSSEAYFIHKNNNYLLGNWLLRLALEQHKQGNDKWSRFLSDSKINEKEEIRKKIRGIIEQKNNNSNFNISKKDKLVDLLEVFLAEWSRECDQFIEWRKATDEAWLIIKSVIDRTPFEQNTFLAEEILAAFKELSRNIKINKENIKNGLIDEAVKDVLNDKDSKLSNKVQEWISEIEKQKTCDCDSIKQVIKEICESPTGIRIREGQESKAINKLDFVGLDSQGKFHIHDFYKENPVLKNFIKSTTSTVIQPIPLYTAPVWLGGLFWQLWGLFWQLWIFFHPQLTINQLCSQYKNNGSISCSNSEFGDEIASNNKAVRQSITSNTSKDENNTLKDDQVYVIAVVVPDQNAPPFITQNMLRGVAAQQSQFNRESNSRKIIVLIAKESLNNKNNKGVITADGGVKIAEELVKQTRILGVVGPYSSPSLVNVINNYCTNSLTLVSPTASAPMDDINQIYMNNFSDKKHDPNTKCFFRPTGTNDIAADKAHNYLVTNGYKKVLVMKENDAFADSWIKRFINKNKESNSLSIDDTDKNTLAEGRNKIKNRIEDWKKSNITEKTAILLIKGPKRKDETNIITESVVQANNGKSVIVATNPVYSPDLLGTLKLNRSLNNKHIESIIIAVPWFKPKLGKETQDQDWFDGMSHDATVLLTEAISKEVEAGKNPTVEAGKNPTRADVYQQFQIGLGSITENRTVTGAIKLVGNNRESASYLLIQPKCEDKSCTWTKK